MTALSTLSVGEQAAGDEPKADQTLPQRPLQIRSNHILLRYCPLLEAQSVAQHRKRRLELQQRWNEQLALARLWAAFYASQLQP